MKSDQLAGHQGLARRPHAERSHKASTERVSTRAQAFTLVTGRVGAMRRTRDGPEGRSSAAGNAEHVDRASAPSTTRAGATRARDLPPQRGALQREMTRRNGPTGLLAPSTAGRSYACTERSWALLLARGACKGTATPSVPRGPSADARACKGIPVQRNAESPRPSRPDARGRLTIPYANRPSALRTPLHGA
jgi:hypothetical protein